MLYVVRSFSGQTSGHKLRREPLAAQGGSYVLPLASDYFITKHNSHIINGNLIPDLWNISHNVEFI